MIGMSVVVRSEGQQSVKQPIKLAHNSFATALGVL
jgi:hypothetical protein